MTGVELDQAADLRFLETKLAPYFDELSPRDAPAFPGDFELWNGYYQSGRRRSPLRDDPPPRAEARAQIGVRIVDARHGVGLLAKRSRRTPRGVRRRRSRAAPWSPVRARPHPRGTRQGAGPPARRYLELESSDVLFVDSSHVVKTGSDVNFLILEVLPRLRPGGGRPLPRHLSSVRISTSVVRAGHVSDRAVPSARVPDRNRDYRVVFAAHALVRAERERVSELIPSLRAREEHFPPRSRTAAGARVSVTQRVHPAQESPADKS